MTFDLCRATVIWCFDIVGWTCLE